MRRGRMPWLRLPAPALSGRGIAPLIAPLALALALLGACTDRNREVAPPLVITPQTTSPSPTEAVAPARIPILFRASGGVQAPDTITYLLPGALSTARIFGPLRDMGDDRHLVMEYRFPGMQGQPLDPPMRIDAVAARIAGHAALFPKARINLIGFSTGGAIAIEAAGLIGCRPGTRMVLMSTATPFPGAIDSSLRGGATVAASALQAGSLQARDIWAEYYKTLLYGYGWRARPELRRAAEARAARVRKTLIIPQKGLGRAHARDLLGWTLSPAARASGAEILILHGEKDPVFPLSSVAMLARRIGATLCAVPGGGHLLLETHPASATLTRDFLAGRWSAGECR